MEKEKKKEKKKEKSKEENQERESRLENTTNVSDSQAGLAVHVFLTDETFDHLKIKKPKIQRHKMDKRFLRIQQGKRKWKWKHSKIERERERETMTTFRWMAAISRKQSGTISATSECDKNDCAMAMSLN